MGWAQDASSYHKGLVRVKLERSYVENLSSRLDSKGHLKTKTPYASTGVNYIDAVLQEVKASEMKR
ncbi:MAG: hypothetical protein ACK5MK_04530, partial [Dysgonomonas sp.]